MFSCSYVRKMIAEVQCLRLIQLDWQLKVLYTIYKLPGLKNLSRNIMWRTLGVTITIRDGLFIGSRTIKFYEYVLPLKRGKYGMCISESFSGCLLNPRFLECKAFVALGCLYLLCFGCFHDTTGLSISGKINSLLINRI